jgi:hypothetical protein
MSASMVDLGLLTTLSLGVPVAARPAVAAYVGEYVMRRERTLLRNLER